MKRPFILFLGLFFIGAFLFVGKVSAAVVFDQLVIDEVADNSTQGGVYSTVDNLPFLTSTAPVEEALIFVDNWDVGVCVGCQFFLSLKYLVSGSAVLVESSNRVDAGITGSVSFTFPNNTQSTANLIGIQIGRAFGDFGGTWFNSLPIRGDLSCAGCKLFGGSGSTSFSPYVRLFDNAASSSVSFKNPPFVPFMRTVDFTTWQVCYTLVPTDLPQHFFFRIDYGLTLLTEFSDPSDELTRPGESASACTDIGKSHNLEAGEWRARVSLFDINGVTTPIQSSVLIFDVTGGQQLTLPVNQIISQENLPTTCGTTNLKIAGVDFGQGLCQLFSFLFIPTQTFSSTYADVLVLLETKVPFSYLFEVVDQISSISTTDQNQLPTLSVTVFGTSMSVFNPTTLSNFIGAENLALFRSLILCALGIAALTTIFYTVRSLL